MNFEQPQQEPQKTEGLTPENNTSLEGKEEPSRIAGAKRRPDGTMDYSRAAVMEPSVGSYFGSEKAGRVKEVANIMSRQENPLAGHMLDEMIEFTLLNPEADRNATSVHLMSIFNFDGTSGEKIPLENKQEALRTVMNYFDELQELRDSIIEQKRSK